MNTPVPSSSGASASAVTVAIVGIAGAVAGSLAVWTALAPQADTFKVEHTCQCECVTETTPVPVPAPVPAEAEQPTSAMENEPAPSSPRRVRAARPASSSPPRVRQARAEIAGPLDRDIIRRIVRAHINEVRHCYNVGLIADPELSGRVAVQFTLAASGKVAEAAVASSTLDEDGEGVASCVTKAVSRWEFPKSGAEATVVTYPFVLTPGD